MSDHTYDIGQQVSVPRGLDVVPGVVEGVYGGEGRSEQVVVRIGLEGEESETITVPARILDRARKIKEDHRPGAWLTAYQYEQALAATLATILQSLEVEFRQVRQPVPPDQGVDVAFITPEKIVVVEAKYLTRETLGGEKYLDRLAEHVNRADAEGSGSLSGLLVTNAKVSPRLTSQARRARNMGNSLWVARWAPGDPEGELVDTVRQALTFKVER
ncbi:hypothetical protein ACF07U_06990 [Streptomyces californicus]|uniref:hypothetical protein n=1 Tax=Streptomyces californicus TaxID=67351 RepID=UPI0036FCFFD4